MASGLDTYTKLLVHSDGDVGSYAVVDSGYRSAMGGTQPGGHLPTLVGTAAISTAQSKFGGASLLLDGNSDYISAANNTDFLFGSGNWTVDCWIRFSSLPTTDDSETLVSCYSGPSNKRSWLTRVDNLSDLYYLHIVISKDGSGGSNEDFSSDAVSLAINTWYHVAYVRDGDTIRFFLDGVAVGTGSTSASASLYATDAPLRVGVVLLGTGEYSQYFNGYVDEVRVSKGIARWTSGFSVPTAPYTADGKTNLLLHFDAADTPFTGATPKVGTFVGTAQHAANDTAIAMIGNGSLCLDGDSDYVTAPDSADWTFGTGNFTIDFWIRLSSVDHSQGIIGQYKGADDYWEIDWLDGSHVLGFYSRIGGVVQGQFTCPFIPIADTWYHIAVVRSSTTCYMFIDGVSQTVTQVTAWGDLSTVTPSTLRIGFGENGPNVPVQGYMDEVRICKGTAVWTASFTPSIVPYTNATAANTVLLCHFDNYQIDSSASPHALTQVGTAYNTGDYVVGATSPAVGAGAWRFDGTDDNLSYPDAEDWNFGANPFTIDFWVKFTTIQNSCFCGQFVDEYNIWQFFMYNTNQIRFYSSTAPTIVYSYTWSALTVNTWHHLALVRNGTTLYLFIDGVNTAWTLVSFPVGSIAIGDFASILTVGRSRSSDFGSGFLAGYIDNFRILKGTAAWTTTFTPPTTAYTGADIPTSGNGLYVPFDYDAHDAGGSAHVPTYVSNTYGATALSRFTGSILLDGNSDYLTFVDSDDFSFGDGNFTIDGWVLFKGIGAIQVITSQYEDANNYWYAEIDAANKLTMIFKDGDVKGSYIMTSAWSGLTVNVWYHIAFVRNTTTGLIFINGVSQTLTETTAFGTNDVGNIAGLFEVGDYDTGNNYLNGYLDELRVSKGIARWTANFTPPTAPYGIASTTTFFPFVCNLLQ